MVVVDDDIDHLALMSHWLEAAGYDVDPVDSAEALQTVLATAVPDCVCLDLDLPGVTGMEMLERLRHSHPQLPVIMVTAEREVDVVVRAMQQGAYDYLSKPLTQLRLTTSVKRAVERASRSAEAVLQAHASGGPVLEHQKVALERAGQALDQLRAGASRDLASAMQRDPALLREAAAGRSGPMIEAMAQEARVRADPHLRADRFVERWQQLSQDRDRLYRAGDMTGREKAGKEMAGMAKSLERDPQVESILRNRTRELGLEIGMSRGRDMGGGELGRQLTQELGIDRDRGMSR